jgi:hypothetical protein
VRFAAKIKDKTPLPCLCAMLYTAYGLVFDSELSLPELLQPPATQDVPVDVRIRQGAVREDGLPAGEGTQVGPMLWLGPTAMWLHVPGVARFEVRDGRAIRFEPLPGSDEDSVRVFLLGSALGALLFQRGFLVLHGNAIQVGDQVMVCVGPSGAGKSTLAAGFAQRGYPVLADDVVAVDAQCRAVPGFPRIKLWQDTADQLAVPTDGLSRIRPMLQKFNLPLTQGFATLPVPIRWIYILKGDNHDDIRLRPIRGLERLAPLHRNTYRVRFLDAMALRPDHLQLCARLANQITLTEVTRPKAGFALEALMDRLLDDMAAHPALA